MALPNKMKFGIALGLLGGIIALVAMAYSWGGELDDMYPVGLNMLVAVMFFAAAGTFTKYSPVKGDTVLVISALAMAVTVIAAVYEATFLWVSILLAVIAVCCILIGACPNTFALRKLALLGAMDDYIAISSRELGEALEMSQQSASKRILELLDMKYIVRDLGARKQRIKLTTKGIEDLKKEYNEYRRIFELTDHITIHGKVQSGMGEGGYYICQNQYLTQFREKLGFSPFEGTLNVQIDPEDIGKLDVIKSIAGTLISGFSDEGRSFGDVIAYKAKIRNIDCAIIVPERSHYTDIIEIICQYHLRRTLSLEDGDSVDVKVKL